MIGSATILGAILFATVPATPLEAASALRATATDAEPARSKKAPASAPPSFHRRGGVLRFSPGTRFCSTASCEAIKPGVSMLAMGGWRPIPYLVVGGEFGFGYNTAGAGGHLLGWSAVGLALVHPLDRPRIDPYFGVGIGFNQDRGDGVEFNRGLVRISLGLDVFVTKRVSLGVRYDVDRQFQGKVCGFGGCFKVANVPALRSQLPQWYVASASLKIALGKVRK
jgi:hypothetical protein